MGTCNFWTMDNIPLVVVGDEEVLKWFYGEEYEEGKDYGDLYFEYDIFCEDVRNDLEELLDNLKWYKGELKSGYYSGLQFYFERRNWATLDEWTDGEEDREEMEWEYGVSSKAELVELVTKEEEMINEFLKNMISNYGFRELIHLGTFSNGEAIYRYKDTVIAK